MTARDNANDAMSLYPNTVGPTLPTNPQDGDTHLIPAEHVATLVARSPGRVVSMVCTCGVSVVGDVLPFAAVTRLMLEHLNGGQADTVLRDLTEVPHSRACGIQRHPHGKDCSGDCPTCHGISVLTPEQVTLRRYGPPPRPWPDSVATGPYGEGTPFPDR